ncbi:hypothetical protein V1525DRAFT_399471 [Lipomyces kononenkoae]|uniref:Uncharacterized protein n=1 Tax=Lipomyces kononenkoae TaxID=34357 RepID=A0ACC3T4V5_LIPKO
MRSMSQSKIQVSVRTLSPMYLMADKRRCEDPPVVASAASSARCRRCINLNKDCTFVLSVVETRGRSSYLKTLDSEVSTDSPDGDYIATFKAVFLPACPIISNIDSSSSIFSTHILLTCCMRYLGALFGGAPDFTLAQIKTSIKSYLFTKSPLTRPLPQNIQALALLALRIEDRACGIWLATAIRMACALGWNHSAKPPIASTPLEMTEFWWWTLMCQDVWLFALTGTPTLIYARDCKVRNPSSPAFFCDIVELSNIARHILRPETVDTKMPSAGQDLLANWEATHQGIASVPIPEPPIPQTVTDNLLVPELPDELSQWMPVPPSCEAAPKTSQPMNTTLTPTALIQLVYAAVVGLLVLDPSVSCNRDPHVVTDAQRETILHIALALESRFRHGAFARWRLLVKLADIVGAALSVLGMDRGREWATDRGNGAADIRNLEDLWVWWASGDEEAFQKESGKIDIHLTQE